MNRLRAAMSPYLLQHADNPVDWWQWGDDAFAAARDTDRPVLLSIGYASCHWCHVMAHESFEDPQIAQLINERYIPIKVDREERPDVDAIYMRATQLLSGSGGWPMTVFCDADGRPFHAGTYFPPHDRAGIPSFRRVLLGISAAWQQDRARVDSIAAQVTLALRDADAKVDAGGWPRRRPTPSGGRSRPRRSCGSARRSTRSTAGLEWHRSSRCTWLSSSWSGTMRAPATRRR